MPHPLESLLAGRESAKATTKLAIVQGPSSDGSGNYDVKILETGVTVSASIAIPGLAFSAQQTVLLSCPDGSGRYKNTGYSIIGFPPSLSKNSSQVAATSASMGKSGAAVTLITSSGSPVTSVSLAPNTNVTILIYGTGLNTVTLTYGSTSLMDNVAPIRTPTLLTLQVHAANGMTLGQYDLTVGGIKFSRFFNVTN